MLATTEIECALKRLEIIENNVEDKTEQEFAHMVKENVFNMLRQLKTIEMQLGANVNRPDNK